MVWRLSPRALATAAESLRARGYAVIDGAVGASRAKDFQGEIAALKERNVMYANATHVVDRAGGKQLLFKDHIFEWDTAHPGWPSTSKLIPGLDGLANDVHLRSSLNEAMPELNLVSQTMKIQHNKGSGGCFPVHYDADAGLDTRTLTAILYLNDGWAPGHGGEIQLFPFPYPEVTIEPVMDRIVMFSSVNMPHRVLPSSTHRYCLTLWMSQPTPSSSTLKEAKRAEKEQAKAVVQMGDEPSWEAMMQPACRRLLTKAFLSEQWERSIMDAHSPGELRDSALLAHVNNVSIIRKIFAKALPHLSLLLSQSNTESEALPAVRWFGQ